MMSRESTDGRRVRSQTTPAASPPAPPGAQKTVPRAPFDASAMLYWIIGATAVILTIALAFMYFEPAVGVAMVIGVAMGLVIYGPLRLRASLMHRGMAKVAAPIDLYRILTELLDAAGADTPANAARKITNGRRAEERLAELLQALGTTQPKAMKAVAALLAQDGELTAIAASLGVKKHAQIPGAVELLQSTLARLRETLGAPEGSDPVARARKVTSQLKELSELVALVRTALAVPDTGDLHAAATRIAEEAGELRGVREQLQIANTDLDASRKLVAAVTEALGVTPEQNLEAEAKRIAGDAGALPGIRRELERAQQDGALVASVRTELGVTPEQDLVVAARRIKGDADKLPGVEGDLMRKTEAVAERDELLLAVRTGLGIEAEAVVDLAALVTQAAADAALLPGVRRELDDLRSVPPVQPVLVNPDGVLEQLRALVGERRPGEDVQAAMDGLGRKLDDALAQIAASAAERAKLEERLRAQTEELGRLRPIAARVGEVENAAGRATAELGALQVLHAAASGQLTQILKEGGTASPVDRVKHRVMSQLGEWLKLLLEWEPESALTNGNVPTFKAARRLERAMNRLIVHIIVASMLIQAEEWELLRELLETRFDPKRLKDALEGLDLRIQVWYAPELPVPNGTAPPAAHTPTN